MSKVSEYRQQYHQVFQVMDASQDGIINSLGNLIEDMMETIQKLEEKIKKSETEKS